MSHLEDLVHRITAGDGRACDQLVAEFQDFVFALAAARLPRPDQVQDVCQEVFIEAFQTLPALRQPHALPGRLERLVVKHCDRMVRRRRPQALDPVLADALPAPDEQPGGPAGLDREQVPQLMAALAGLPAGQRIALVLHYLCHRPVAAIAEALAISEGAVRKRLFDGRNRCAERIRAMLDRSASPMPRQDPGFARAMRFFLAVRTGQLETVAQLLQEEPELVHAREQWLVRYEQEQRLPDASGQTALIRAAQNGDAAMMDLLLAHGARVVDACSCANGEQALHAAILGGDLPGVERLLRAGSRVEEGGFRGMGALHLAAMRGHHLVLRRLLAEDVEVDVRDPAGRTPLAWAAIHGSAATAQELLSAGADPRLRDGQGRSAGDWARLRGHLELARQLEAGGELRMAGTPAATSVLKGRRFTADGSASDGGTTLAAALQALEPGSAGAPGTPGAGAAAPQAWTTGIKVIDLFCPLPAGGRIAVHGCYGVGLLIVLAEISRRLQARHGVSVVWAGWEQHHAQYSDLAGELVEIGVDRQISMLWHRHTDDPAAADLLAGSLEQAAEALREAGRDLLIILQDHPGRSETIGRLLALADAPAAEGGVAGPGRVGVMLIHDLMAPQPAMPLAPPWAARIAFDTDLRRPGCYPAVHPVRSMSRLGVPEAVVRAREALAALRRHASWPDRPSELPLELERAWRCQWYLSQPFEVTELFLNRPGVMVEPDEASAFLEEVLRGDHDQLPLERLHYLGGALEPA